MRKIHYFFVISEYIDYVMYRLIIASKSDGYCILKLCQINTIKRIVLLIICQKTEKHIKFAFDSPSILNYALYPFDIALLINDI